MHARCLGKERECRVNGSSELRPVHPHSEFDLRFHDSDRYSEGVCQDQVLEFDVYNLSHLQDIQTKAVLEQDSIEFNLGYLLLLLS